MRAQSFNGQADRFVARAVRALTPKRLWAYALILIVADLLAYLLLPAIAAAGSGNSLVKTFARDFVAPYTGGRFFWEGRLVELYNDSAVAPFQRSLIGLTEADGFHRFINPPYAAVLFAPFALGSYVVGLAAYYGAGLALLAGAVFVLYRHLDGWQKMRFGRLMAMAFLFYPTLAWLLFGQYSSLTLVIYVASFFLLRQKRDFAAGCVIGLLAYKPQLAIGLALVLLVQRRWRAVLGGGVAVAVWLVIGFAMSPEAMLRFVQVMPHLMASQAGGEWAEHSLVYFGILLAGGWWPAGGLSLGWVLSLAVAAVVAHWWWRQPWQPGTRAWDLTLAASLALGLLLSPHLLTYDLLVLLLPLAVVWRHYSVGTHGRALDGGPLLVASAALWLALYFARYLTLTQLSLAGLAGLPPTAIQISTLIILLWAVLVRRAASKETPSAPPEPREPLAYAQARALA